MKFIYGRKISAAIVALIFLCLFPRASLALPLTDTVYTIGEENFEFLFTEEIHEIKEYYRSERVGVGFGLLPRFSVWLFADYLHSGIDGSKGNVMGDLYLKFWYYIGDYLDDRLHLGVKMRFRIPSGPDAYSDDAWRNMALGHNELDVGLSGKYDIAPWLFTHFNLDYIFRQGADDNFYGGFHINPVDGDTYRTLLGLNPFADDAFLSGRRLKNDYMRLSAAVNTGRIYPVIPYGEASWSFRLYRGKIAEDALPIEGGGIDPFLLSLGGRFFFTRTLYAGFHVVINPLWNDGFTKIIYGLDFAVEF